MSAYIVEDKTINGIVAFLRGNRNLESAVDYRLRPLGHGVYDREHCEALASALYLMNCDAVDDRYGKGTAAQDEAEVQTFPYRALAPGGSIPTFKSLQCFLYQCSEGDVPERPLYKAMEAIKNALAEQIIDGLPAYEKAVWG